MEDGRGYLIKHQNVIVKYTLSLLKLSYFNNDLTENNLETVLSMKKIQKSIHPFKLFRK